MEPGAKSWRLHQGHQVKVSRLLLRNGYTRLESPASISSAEHEDSPMLENRTSGLNSETSKLNAESLGVITRNQWRQRQRRRRGGKWRFRIRPKIRVLHCSVSGLLRSMRDCYARVVLALATKARDTSVRPLLYKKKPPLPRNSSQNERACTFSDIEQKYIDYIRRSAADGELAYYTAALRQACVL